MFCICSGLHFDFLIITKSFHPFKPSSNAFCEHCAFNFTSVLYVSSFMISTVVIWSLIPFMNCSFGLLSISLYLSFVVLTLSLPIHSSTDSFESLTSSQYCCDNIVALCCGLNLSPSISHSPFTVSHASCPTAVKVFIKCNPSLPSKIFTMGTPFMCHIFHNA